MKNQEKEKEKNKFDNEKEDMISADIKIEQLAKDLKLFQYNNKLKNRPFNNDLLPKNNFSEDEYINALPIINSDNTILLNSKSQSRISSGIPLSRLNSEKMNNDVNIIL